MYILAEESIQIGLAQIYVAAILVIVPMIINGFLQWQAGKAVKEVKQDTKKQKELIIADAKDKNKKLKRIFVRVDGRLSKALNNNRQLRKDLLDQALMLADLRLSAAESGKESKASIVDKKAAVEAIKLTIKKLEEEPEEKEEPTPPEFEADIFDHYDENGLENET
jgi:small-conductance mechanosensitive channel